MAWNLNFRKRFGINGKHFFTFKNALKIHIKSLIDVNYLIMLAGTSIGEFSY